MKMLFAIPCFLLLSMSVVVQLVYFRVDQGQLVSARPQLPTRFTMLRPDQKVDDYSSDVGTFSSEGRLKFHSVCEHPMYKVDGAPFRNYLKPIILAAHHVWLKCGDDISLKVRIDPSHSRHGRKRGKLPNIQTFVFDALSRAHFLRSMKESVQILNSAQRFGYQMFDFEKMHALGGFSMINKAPLYLGRYVRQADKGARTRGWIWEGLESLGYETLYAGLTYTCGNGNSPDHFSPNLVQYYFKNTSQVKHTFPMNIQCENLKHDLRVGHTCPHTIHKYDFGATLPICAGHKPLVSHFSDYLDKFNQNYRQFPKLSSVEIFETHEDSMKMSYVLDKHFARMLQRQMVQGTNETVIFVMADHGMHLGDYAQSESGFEEMMTPPLFLLIPQSLLALVPGLQSQLVANSHTVVTHFDVHNALRRIPHLFGGGADLSVRASLFDALPSNRTCLHAGIPIRQCIHIAWKQLSNSDFVKKLISKAISILNSKVKRQQGNHTVCSKLKLKSIVRAQLKESATSTVYQLQFSTISTRNEAPVFRITMSSKNSHAENLRNLDLVKLGKSRQLTRYVEAIRPCVKSIRKFRIDAQLCDCAF